MESIGCNVAVKAWVNEDLELWMHWGISDGIGMENGSDEGILKVVDKAEEDSRECEKSCTSREPR